MKSFLTTLSASQKFTILAVRHGSMLEQPGDCPSVDFDFVARLLSEPLYELMHNASLIYRNQSLIDVKMFMTKGACLFFCMFILLSGLLISFFMIMYFLTYLSIHFFSENLDYSHLLQISM